MRRAKAAYIPWPRASSSRAPTRLTRSQPASRQATGPILGLLVAALAFAVVLGLGVATGQRLVIIALAALLGGLAVLATPVKWTFWTMIVMSFVVVGPVTYFLRLSQVQWLPALFGLALYLQVMVLLLAHRASDRRAGLPGFLYLLILFWVSIAMSSLMAGISMGELLMASRYYLFVWGALMVFVVGAIDAATIDKLWRSLLLIACLQLPLALYQYLFVAKQRVTGELLAGGAPAWDAVIGTFPGTDTGGGNSAAMAFFLLVAIVLAIALWRERQLQGWKAAVVVLLSFGAIALAEVKAVVLLIPVAMAMYYWRELARRPAEALAALVLASVLAVGILWGYQKLHYDQVAAHPRAINADATVYERILHQIDPEGVNESNDRVGRVAHLFAWWDIHVQNGDLYHALLGYGVGTTQASSFEVGTLVRRFGADIGRSSAIVLLWETGALGLMLYVAMLGSAAMLSRRLAADGRVPQVHRVYLRTGAIGLALCIITLAYKPYALRLTSVQLLIILMMGQAIYWRAQLGPHSRRLASQAELEHVRV